MCGIAGLYSTRGPLEGDVKDLLERMGAALDHRGPNDQAIRMEPNLGLVTRRLSINDLTAPATPFTSEDGLVVAICNGEVFNWRELRSYLESKGHRFKTQVDTEVIPHLYEEYGEDAFSRINGQFAVALYDARVSKLLLVRDQLGIIPLHYHHDGDRGLIVFGSEAKAVLEHEAVPRDLDLVGLDQALTFPGLVSPRTVFRSINTIRPGHMIRFDRSGLHDRCYWDLDFPLAEDLDPDYDEVALVEELRELFTRSVELRTVADVGVGCYLSGGLDSSLITATVAQVTDYAYETMSVTFPDADIDESRYQREMVDLVGGRHHQRLVTDDDIVEQLRTMVGFAETPVKESYNVCSLMLSRLARETGHTVILTGEGSDELFGGYPGYRMDTFGAPRGRRSSMEELLEMEANERIFGLPDVGYERHYARWRQTVRDLYAPAVRHLADGTVDRLVDGDKLSGRHRLHQRSYLDMKLRLPDHLLGDHGDRMAMANSVEARFPFIDIAVVDFATRLHPDLMVGSRGEKHIVKRVAEGMIPERIVDREKYGFRASSSPTLLRQGLPRMADLLAPDTISRQGVFDPDTVARLRAAALEPDNNLHPHVNDDHLMLVVTTGLLIDLFDIPDVTSV